MSQTSEEISLDSMETAFSSDDPTLAELEEPSCQKILESDMIRISTSDCQTETSVALVLKVHYLNDKKSKDKKHASPIMDRLCLGIDEFQKVNELANLCF